MMDFDAAFGRLLDCAEQDMHGSFAFARDALVEGRWVALLASFDVEGERKPFGIVPTGNMTHCHERCLFVPVAHLDAQTLAEQLAYIAAAHDALVQPDKGHEFSMFSLVIGTAEMDPAVAKILKKFNHEKNYHETASGWSTVRVAVVDLANRKIFANRLGSALGDRLKPTVKRL